MYVYITYMLLVYSDYMYVREIYCMRLFHLIVMFFTNSTWHYTLGKVYAVHVPGTV